MTDIAERLPAGSHSIIASTIDKLVLVCGVIPYALVALLLRLVMARVVFLAGQSKIEGPQLPIHVNDFTFSVVLPAGVRDATFRMFETQYANLPLSPTVAAYLYSYAEFVLPICLVLGFATRISATVMLVMTVLLAVFVMPDALWTTHVYWGAILLVLMTVGPGAISVDQLIRYIYEKQ